MDLQSIYQGMQVSHDSSDWKEDERVVSLRYNLTTGHPSAYKRRLYPISCKLIAGVAGTKWAEGTRFMYARTKMIPSRLPVEVIFAGDHGKIATMSFYAGEVEILPPIAPEVGE